MTAWVMDYNPTVVIWWEKHKTFHFITSTNDNSFSIKPLSFCFYLPGE